ncbi:MAG: glycosyltransferase family 4 protein [Paludibacteraceae bacterium]|nr:glycosyltransferase family 4 protein [Paludibacteraceae bacterium]MBN2786975.1 glycosyltransferase family 4 protein [Paludibacteraceae bacterium]
MNKLLFIRYKKTTGILEGGEQASQKNYDLLATLLGKENITTYYIHDEAKKKKPIDYLRGIFYFLRNYYFGLTPSRVEEIVLLADAYEYVFIDRSVFGIVAKKLKEHGFKGQIISFFHNVEEIYFSAKISRFAPWRRLVLHCADANDRYTATFSDKIIALNSRDAQEIEHRYNRQVDMLIPITFKDRLKEIPPKEKLTSTPPLCLFIGSYFAANTEGILWFIKEVYPSVSIRLKIVGKGMDKLRKKVSQEIEIISDAPDINFYFEEADIILLPIFKGSGMKVKTCESLMFGKNIVGTTEAFEGYELEYNKVGALCNTKQDFIHALKDFSENPRPKFNAYSRQVYLEKYAEVTVIDKFKTVLGL